MQIYVVLVNGNALTSFTSKQEARDYVNFNDSVTFSNCLIQSIFIQNNKILQKKVDLC